MYSLVYLPDISYISIQDEARQNFEICRPL